MSSRSGVDENTLAIAGSGQMSAQTGVDEDTVMIYGSGVDENGLEIDGQHAVPSKHQVDKLLILPREFEDSNQIIDVKLFTDRSSPISPVNDVTLKRASDPNSIEGYRKVIDEQNRSLKTSFNLG